MSKEKKITVCLTLLEDDFKKYRQNCHQMLSSPSREISLFIKDELKKQEAQSV